MAETEMVEVPKKLLLGLLDYVGDDLREDARRPGERAETAFRLLHSLGMFAGDTEQSMAALEYAEEFATNHGEKLARIVQEEYEQVRHRRASQR